MWPCGPGCERGHKAAGKHKLAIKTCSLSALQRQSRRLGLNSSRLALHLQKKKTHSGTTLFWKRTKIVAQYFWKYRGLWCNYFSTMLCYIVPQGVWESVVSYRQVSTISPIQKCFHCDYCIYR